MTDIKPIRVSINEDTNGTTENRKRDFERLDNLCSSPGGEAFQRLELYIQELADEDIIRSRKSCLI